MIELSQYEFQTIIDFVRTNFGLNLEKRQYLVENRLRSEFLRSSSDSFAEYWNKLNTDRTGTMVAGLLDCLTTQYTYFNREEKHFEYLKETLVQGFNHPLFIWCAGCATGQEAYTLAMLLAECQASGKLKQPYRIIATDISNEAITAAQTGIYHETEFKRLPENWKTNYCLMQANGDFIVSTPIRDTVQFIRQNLMNTRPGFKKFDIIFCRNVLIYFREKERDIVVNNLFEALQPGGYLFIGHTESLLGCNVALDYIKPAVYHKPKGGTNAQTQN